MTRVKSFRILSLLVVCAILLLAAPAVTAQPMPYGDLSPAPSAPHAPRIPQPGAWTFFANLTGGASLNAVAMSMASPTDGWIVGDQAKVWHYNGTNWAAIPSGVTDPTTSLNSVSAVPGQANKAVVVGDAGTILYCDANAGVNTCTKEATPGTTKGLDSVWMLSAAEGWAGGGGGTMLHFVAGTWHLVDVGVTSQFHAVQMLDATHGWAVGENSTVMHFTNGMWNAVTNVPSPAQSLFGVWFINDNEGWVVGGPAVGGPGLIWHYLNGSWTPESNPATGRLWYTYMLPDLTGFATGNGGTVLYRDGATWITSFVIPGTVAPPIYGVWLSSTTEGWAVAGNGDVYHYGGTAQRPPPVAWFPILRRSK